MSANKRYTRHSLVQEIDLKRQYLNHVLYLKKEGSIMGRRYNLKWIIKATLTAGLIGLVVLVIGGIIADLFEINISEARFSHSSPHQVTVTFTLQSNYKMNLLAPFFKIPDLWYQLRSQTCHPFLDVRDNQNNCLPSACNQDFSKQTFQFYQNEKMLVKSECQVDPGTYIFFYGLSCDEGATSECDNVGDTYSSYFTVR